MQARRDVVSSNRPQCSANRAQRWGELWTGVQPGRCTSLQEQEELIQREAGLLDDLMHEGVRDVLAAVHGDDRVAGGIAEVRQYLA